jgi:nitric oxide reductase large subunit
MKKLWLIFIAIFVFSFAILGWVGTEIFRQSSARSHSWQPGSEHF